MALGAWRAVSVDAPKQARTFLAPDTSFPLTPLQATIVACVRALPGELPRSGLAKVLVGSDSVRTLNWLGHPFFGVLQAYPRKVVLHHVDVLLQQKVLALDQHDHVILPDAQT